jgi:hypothetical protein
MNESQYYNSYTIIKLKRTYRDFLIDGCQTIK